MSNAISETDRATDNNHNPTGATAEGPWSRFIRWFSILENACLYFSGGCIVLLTILLSYEIVQRKLFNRSLLGIEEILELSMIFITFLALSSIQKDESHLRVDLLYDKIILSSRGRYFRFLILAVCFLFFIVFFVISCQYVLSMNATGEFTNTLHLPKVIFFVAIPFSAFVFVIRLIIQMIGYKSNP